MLELSKLGKAKDLLVVLSQMMIEGCSLDLKVYSILIQKHAFTESNQGLCIPF